MTSKPRLEYFFWVAAAVALTWLVHELAHWATGTLLGYPMKMTLNTAGVVDGGDYAAEWHGLLVTAAGPLITLLQAGVVFMMLRRSSNAILYPFLFVPFYMRLMAGVMNLMSLNDEGKLSQALGLGTFALPALVTVFLLMQVIVASRAGGFKARLQVGTTLAVMFWSSILILSDQFVGIRLL